MYRIPHHSDNGARTGYAHPTSTFRHVSCVHATLLSCQSLSPGTPRGPSTARGLYSELSCRVLNPHAVKLPGRIVGSLPRVQQDAECPRDSGIENRAFDDLERVLWRRVLQREPLLEAAEVVLVYRPRRHEVSAQYCTQSKEGRVLPTRTCALLYSHC